MPAGRPTQFKAEFTEQAATLSSLGAIDAELAEFFGVSVTTLNNWKLTYPEFLASIKDAKAHADQRVERTLYQKAISGDTTAMIFWLKNRKKDDWRDKQEHEVSGNLGVTLVNDIPRPNRD